MSIRVTMKEHTNCSPIDSTKQAAGICYQTYIPELGEYELADFKKKLFDTGHHTTIAHWSASFLIEGIAVSDVTLGLHLVHPFYNTDQRSGRFASEMFDKPDISGMLEYVKTYWPAVNDHQLGLIYDYITQGLAGYHKHLPRAIEVAKRKLKQERPNLSDKKIDALAEKIAQEQLRVFIPTIFPTGLKYTIDIVTLFSLYYSAWTPVLRAVIEQMATLVTEKYPEAGVLFEPKLRDRLIEDWAPELYDTHYNLHHTPSCKVLDIDHKDWDYEVPLPRDMFPIDLLHFKPQYQDNLVRRIKMKIEISLMTMGQDQRHRTIHRGQPEFTGNYYAPPLVIESQAFYSLEKQMRHWIELHDVLPATLVTALAPYGAMVTYEKEASLNALFHEWQKRTCFCAQEEIYHLNVLLYKQLKERHVHEDFLKLLSPPCYRNPKHQCAEGDRYCGRDLDLLLDDPLPKRGI